ncbi:hypothetical protein Q1695_012926 [Nippostrongylus brasiliensis]|nr:hypothetical protein Q1695_012926 [Nippostrongylus brasiliensis]
MVEYGCNVANKFGFPMSDDEEFDDPQELITRVAQLEAEKAAAQKKADKLAKQAAAAPPPKEPVKSAGKENSKPVGGERGGRGGGRGGRGRGGAPRPPRAEGEFADRFGEGRGGRGGPRGGRGGPRGGGAFRGRGGSANTFSDAPKDVQDNHLEEVTHESAPVEFQGERRGRGGRGNFNGERRGRGGPFRGGRQFDRQSGSDRTGVRGVDKKDGHGRGNWGDDKDELVGETEPIAVPEEPEVPREKTAEELAQEALEAEYAKQKTLKEYFEAQKKEAPKFNVRKAGEGEEENFGKLVKLQKEVMVDKEEEEVSIIRREPREKALHIDIQFAEPNRGFRGDRPPRGRGARGGGGGRGGRGGNRPQAPPQFDSSLDAFPALGSK